MRALLRTLIGTLTWTLLPTLAAAENCIEVPAAFCSLFPMGCQGGGCLSGTGAEFVDTYLSTTGLLTLQICFVAVMVGMLFYYSSTLITKSLSGNESAISESKTAFTYAIAGSAVASFSVLIVGAFNVGLGGNIPNYDILDIIFGNIYTFFKVMLGIALTVNIVLQAFRLITSQGSDELTGRARKRLISGFLGVGVVLLANAFIVSVSPEGLGRTPNATIMQIAGVVNFLLTLVGAMTLGALLIAGLLLIISVDEGLKDTAKKIIRTSLFTLFLILLSFVILNFFIAFDGAR